MFLIKRKKEYCLEDYSDIEKNNKPIISSTSTESGPEKPYYQPNKKPENQVEKDKKISSFFHNLIIYLDLLGLQEIFFLKIFLRLIIQFIIIFIFTLLGFIFEINKVITKNDIVGKVFFYSISILILIMCYSALLINESKRGSPWLYIYLILYIPCMVYYCFLISSVTDNVNVLCGLILYILDILTFIITILIFQKIYYILFMAFSALITTITLLIFHFGWIKDGLVTFKISTVGLSEILYIVFVAIYSIEKVNKYLYATIVFDLAIFSPFAALVLLILVIAFLLGVLYLDSLSSS